MATEEDLDALLARQKKEQKALVSQTTSLKKSVTKGEKAKRKEVLAEVQRLEDELKQRHERELAELQKRAASSDSADLNGVKDSLPVEDSDLPTIQAMSIKDEADATKAKIGKPKVNRQKARMVLQLAMCLTTTGKEGGRIG